MRKTPEIFDELCMTSLGFDATSAGVAHTCFDMLASSHGDGNKYEWDAADGIRKYTIQRGERTVHIDGWPINEWALKVETAKDTRQITVNCIDTMLLDKNGEPCTNELANEVFRATLDARDERDSRDRYLRFFTLPSGLNVTNPSYQPPIEGL